MTGSALDVLGALRSPVCRTYSGPAASDPLAMPFGGSQLAPTRHQAEQNRITRNYRPSQKPCGTTASGGVGT